VERQRQALELRLSGATLDVIAKELHFRHPSGVAYAVEAALKRTLEPAANEVRKIEIARLDRALLSIWRSVLNGHHGAIDRYLKISDRRARLLGLDAPVKLSGNITSDLTIKIVDEDEDDGTDATTDDNND